jgi:death-on-curing protein
MEPVFLTSEDILLIHQDQVRRYGGSVELRDYGLLLSAIEMPSFKFGDVYLHASTFEMAAAYLFHIVQNHPFVDGNKRTGAAAALVFLDLNNIEVHVEDETLAEFVLSIAQGLVCKQEIAQFLRAHSAV